MRLILFTFVLVLVSASSSADDYVSGVSVEAISLPSLPGSVEGLPITLDEIDNRGEFKFSIDLKTPRGVNGLAPSLSVIYSSSYGQSEFGLGWKISLPSIKIDPKRGVPTYTDQDRFIGLDGELVQIERAGENKFFASYINKKQDIYEYDENNRTWIVHQGNGRKLYFGLDTSSVVLGANGIYEWFIEKEVDSVGNQIIYEYLKDGGYPYLSKVKYAYKDESPHYEIRLIYELREDSLESYRSTSLIVISKRCSRVEIRSAPNNYLIRSYEFIYKNQENSKVTLLQEVKQHGEGGDDLNPPMPPLKFDYSFVELDLDKKTKSLSFSDSSTFPPSLNKPRAILVDINRDSFPDVVETSSSGAKVWINDRSDGFRQHYTIPEFISVLGDGLTKIIDVDGDRIVDFLATGLYPKFFKGGVTTQNGDFGFSNFPSEVSNIPRYSIGSPNVQTIDLNADGRLDIIAREVDHFKTFISSSSGKWDRAQDFAVNTGAFDLSSPYTFFADMNGDGLVDLVFVREKAVIYLPSIGTGLFSSPVMINFEESDPLILKLFKIGKFNFVIDINSDGYNDLINATESTLAISLNLGNGSFGPTKYLTSIHEDDFNLKGLHITVGDMNGNGSTDILWTNDFHDWRYLDFITVQPNLMIAVDNGLGLKTKVEYTLASSYGDNLESEDALLPYPQTVVKKITESYGNTPTAIKEDQYRYFGGFYHAFENDFRGFNLVEKIEVGDSSIDSLYIKSFYEQGRVTSKDHQQFMLLKKSEFDFTGETKSPGNLLRETEYILSTAPTFESLEDKYPGFPFASTTIFTEGDFDPQTANRTHKQERQIIMNSEGVIEKDKLLIYLDMSQLVRIEEKVLAVANIQNSHITNRLCENNIYNPSNALIFSERYFFDGEANICSLTSGLVTKKVAWNGSSYENKNNYSYKSFGALSAYTDSFGRETTIDYDDFNINPATITNPAAHTRVATYNSDNGLMNSLTDENGLVTSLYYDLYQRIIKIVGPGDTLSLPTTEAIYTFGTSSGDPSSLLTKKREKSGVAGTFDTKEYFDGKGRSTFKITEGPTNRNVLEGTTYNRRGEKHLVYQKSFVSDFNFPSSISGVRYFETRYDSLKRPVIFFNPEHTPADPSYRENFHLVGETITYDEERKVSYEYTDSLGRRTGHLDALESLVSYEFNGLDLLVKITDPQGSETLFGYDSQKRRTCKVDPTVGLTVYSYNTENLVTQKDMYGFVSGHNVCSPPTGVTPRSVNMEYNDYLNRITKVDFPSGSDTEDVLYSYDELTSTYPKGKLTSVNFGIGSKKFDFDIYGNQSKVTLNIGPSSYPTEKVYNALGKIEKIIYPTLGGNALTIDYEFDEATNLKSVKDNSNSYVFANDMKYSPLGQVEEVLFGNNTKTTMTYDNANQSYRLNELLVEKIGIPNTTLQEIEYEYDKVSNITQRMDQKNTFTEAYSYDDLHRLTGADLGGVSKSWAFDEIGNITNNNGVVYSYIPTRKQAISSVGSGSYGFDAFGNISFDADRTYVFDWNNRLRSMTKASQTTTYDYGEDGLRVIKATPSQTTIFIDKFTELRGSDIVRHIYADKKLIASIDELNDITYSHSDHLNSSSLKTDSSGNIVKRIEYMPFGTKRLEVGSYNNIKHRFTGQYEDEESNLYYYQQRYYDPVLSRFISADPLYLDEMDERGTDSQELNLYSYVRNNPILYTDPTGLLVSVSGVNFSVNAFGFGVSVSYLSFVDSKFNDGKGWNLSAGATVATTPGVSLNYVQGLSTANSIKDMAGFGLEKSVSYSFGLNGGLGVNFADKGIVGLNAYLGIGTLGASASAMPGWTGLTQQNIYENQVPVDLDFGLDSGISSLGESSGTSVDAVETFDVGIL